MAYKFKTTKQRSEIMKKIKRDNTTPEIALRKKLWSKGIRYRKNYNKLPGRPDIVIARHKLAIFIDGEFWHGRNWETRKAKIESNRDYWIPKIEGNILRDKKNKYKLKKLGWKVLRFWSLDVLKKTDRYVEKVIKKLHRNGR